MSHPSVNVEELTLLDRRNRLPILHAVSMTLHAGTVTGLTGGSGTGKTTLMRALLGALPATTRHTAGSIHVAGQEVLRLDPGSLRRFRRAEVSFVGQDPGSALNPAMRVHTILAEATTDPIPSSRLCHRSGCPRHCCGAGAASCPAASSGGSLSPEPCCVAHRS